MAAQIRSSMAAILPIVETRLQTVTGLPEECVRPWLGEEAPHLQADQDLVVRLKGFTPTGSWQEGSGRYATQIEEKIEVGIRTRISLDEVGVSRAWLYGGTDEAGTGSALGLRNLVLSALQGFLPADEAGNVLVDSELLLVPSQAPKADASKASGWGEERLTFLCKYTQTLDLTLSTIP